MSAILPAAARRTPLAACSSCSGGCSGRSPKRAGCEAAGQAGRTDRPPEVSPKKSERMKPCLHVNVPGGTASTHSFGSHPYPPSMPRKHHVKLETETLIFWQKYRCRCKLCKMVKTCVN